MHPQSPSQVLKVPTRKKKYSRNKLLIKELPISLAISYTVCHHTFLLTRPDFPLAENPANRTDTAPWEKREERKGRKSFRTSKKISEARNGVAAAKATSLPIAPGQHHSTLTREREEGTFIRFICMTFYFERRFEVILCIQ